MPTKDVYGLDWVTHKECWLSHSLLLPQTDLSVAEYFQKRRSAQPCRIATAKPASPDGSLADLNTRSP